MQNRVCPRETCDVPHVTNVFIFQFICLLVFISSDKWVPQLSGMQDSCSLGQYPFYGLLFRTANVRISGQISSYAREPGLMFYNDLMIF